MKLVFSKSDGTIGRKLLRLATISVSLALLLTCSVFAGYGIVSMQNAKWEQLNSQAGLLALNSVAAVEFQDSGQANRLLTALRAAPSVKAAALYSADGKLIGSYPGQSNVEASMSVVEPNQSDHSFLDYPIENDGEIVGKLRFLVDFSDLRSAILNYALLTVMVGLGSWAVAVYSAFVLQRSLVRPIDNLARVARRISDHGNYGLRVEGTVRGELGDLYRAFNGMLSQIESSKQELLDANNHLEQRVGERTNELVAALDAAQAASRAKSEFLANMSHEIRTPLNAIMGYTDVLRRNWVNSPEERTEMLSTVHLSGRHLMTVLNDILDLSKIESGKLEIEVRPESPHSVLSEVVSLMRVSFREKNLSLNYTWEGPIPSQIETDFERLRQILLNLVSNARKFTKSGGVQLIARLDQVLKPAQLIVDVIDTGVGIASDQLGNIFEPFVQADNSVTRKFGGTGLGLSISRRLARLLGGDLTVSSVPGQGSTFRVAIAVGELEGVSFISSGTVSDVIPSRMCDPIQSDLIHPLDGLRVLVVDDGVVNRKLISLVLSRSGAEILEAEDGRDACELVFSGRNFDVILLDMQMPVMDGYAAARKLRDAGVTTPIVALTAHAMKGDRDKCIEAGCSDFLSKPVSTDELLLKMKAIYRPRVSTDVLRIPENRPLIYSKLPTEDPEFAEIVIDFDVALKREVKRLTEAVKSRDPVRTLAAAHWIQGSGGTAGFPCFCSPAMQICEAVRGNSWTEINRHLMTIHDLTDRVRPPESAILV